MSRLLGVRFPTHLPALGLSLPARLGPLHVSEGEPAWAWSGAAPGFAVPNLEMEVGDEVPGWGVDHVVVTAPGLQEAVDRLTTIGADFRRMGETHRGEPAAFLLAGTLIEVIEVKGRPPRLAGVAFETDEPLDEVARRWRAAGLDPTPPHDAVQSGRQILSLRGERVAVMTRRPRGQKTGSS